MSCLGERLTALVDGELGHEERDRALAHLACCDRCRDEVASLRKLKGRLRGLDETGELPSPDFLTRLRTLPAAAGSPAPGDETPPEPAGPRSEPLAGPLAAASAVRHSARPLRSAIRPARVPTARPRDNRPSGRGAAAALGVQPRRRYLVMGAATLFLGLGGVSYVVGGGGDAPTVTPAFDRYAVQHALTSGDAPMTDPLTDPANQVQVSPGP
ncbi:zf-HC2 domain-containing protein [Actinomadura sp. KC216]|uniref:anti-sigma factor family protein n=1 Tax=Actinomadura sp. KC216 TaxID=2530370 RepID=UPI001404E67B|nr:zf-HC2 domain-containing protein [Actinomadura sp. KC216]